MVGLLAGETPTEAGTEVLPCDLEDIPPGNFLAAILSSVHRSLLSGYDTVRLMKARYRQVAHDQALLYADMVEVSHRNDAEWGRLDDAFEYASDEIKAALAKTRRSAVADLDLATELEKLPNLWKALHDGRIDLPKTRVMINRTSHLSTEAALDVVDQILPLASRLTTGQLGARIGKLCIETDPETAKKRYEQAVDKRRTGSELNPTGTANLYGIDLAPNKVAAIKGQIEARARALKLAGDPRKMDQLRADIFVDLLLGRHQGSRHGGGVITLTSDLETLARLAEKAADIPGLGAVIADIAEQVLIDHPDADIRYRITTPDGPATGIPSRTATGALRRHIETRDMTCVAPGCRMPATDCDIDHRTPYHLGGPTDDRNEEPLCRHDHIVKDKGRWKLRRNRDGSYTWTTPLGHTDTTHHPP